MVRKRTKPEPIFMGKEKEIDWDAYYEACRIARYCDNLPPLLEDYKKRGKPSKKINKLI